MPDEQWHYAPHPEWTRSIEQRIVELVRRDDDLTDAERDELGDSAQILVVAALVATGIDPDVAVEQIARDGDVLIEVDANGKLKIALEFEHDGD